MHHQFSSESCTKDSQSQFHESPQGFMGMLYGENGMELGADTFNFEPTPNDIEDDTQHHTSQLPETQASSKKRTKVVKQKAKAKKKRGSTSKALPSDGAESKDEEGPKGGPNWKEHWIVNLIHLRGTMHDKFSGMKKQGVNNWDVLHTRLVASCPDFDRSSDACRKKWKKIYDDYKSDYSANGVSGNERTTKCKWYGMIDGYMHDRANVYKYVHGSAQDEDPNTEVHDGQEVADDNVLGTQPTQTSSQTPSARTTTSQCTIEKKSDKIATQEAIVQMAEQSKRIVDAMKEAEAGKLALF